MTSTPAPRALGPADLQLVTGAGTLTGNQEKLTLTAPAGCDLIADPVSGTLTQGAPFFGFEAPEGDFQLSARVTVPGTRTDYDAAVLALYASPTRWAKLCFEYSPDGEPMAVGVVTDGHSDDANGDVIDSESTHLRISRLGEAVAFHHSPDGVSWRFLRVFRWPSGTTFQVGIMAQSPLGPERTVTFENLTLSATTLQHLRDHR